MPQFYLRRFTHPANNKIWVFDKESNKTFPTNVTEIASKRGFYDSLLDDHIAEFESQGVEKLLSRAEGIYAQLLEELINSVRSGGQIPIELRKRFAWFLWLQYTRTDSFRQRLPEFHSENVDRKIAQIWAFQDAEFIKDFVAFTENKIWTVGTPKGHREFMTNDNPVLINPLEENLNVIIQNTPNGFSANTKGIDLLLSLSPRYVLVLSDPEYSPHLISLDGQIRSFADGEMDQFNIVLVGQAKRHIYASRNGYEITTAKIISASLADHFESNKKHIA